MITKQPSEKVRIRPARFADGMWYSSDAERLTAELDRYLAEAPVDIRPGDLVGLVAPHAGHHFSGHVAGAAFATLPAGAFETVILLGPDHRGAAPGRISTPDVEAWRTPLGDIPVAWDILEAVRDQLDLTLLATDDEHSLEIELPFLQQRLGQFRLAPFLMGSQTLESCGQLSAALVTAIEASPPPAPLLVASSDLSHFFADSAARQLDDATLRYVLDMDAAGLVERVQQARHQGQPLACGAGPIATVMLTAQALGARQARLLKYATSADVHPQRDRVVGYAAIALTR